MKTCLVKMQFGGGCTAHANEVGVHCKYKHTYLMN